MQRSGIALTGRRYLRRLSDASVRSTSRVRLLPDFLIVGAQRSGTTSMFKALVQHPRVARPFTRKGVHYFDKHYDEGMSWYRGHFPIAMTSTVRRLGHGRPLTGESSPYYMFHPLAADRIAADLPAVKLIVLLRDPVERAYSGHSHELARGFETEPFQRALELECNRLAGERDRMLADPGYDSWHWQHHAHRTRGQYIDQLLRLEKLVGRDRLHVVDSHDFFRDPAVAVSEVLRFLGLPDHQGAVYERHNARSRAPMDPAVRLELETHYAPYDERLAEWWGRVPSWRR